MVVNKYLTVIFVLVCCAALTAQNVKVSATLRDGTIGLSDQMQLELKISSDKKLDMAAPAAPQVPGFSYRNVLSSTGVQSSFINGKFSSSHTKTFTYIYLPQKKGVFRVPGFRLRIGGKDYATPDLSVTVEDSATTTKQPQQYSFDPYYDPFGGIYPDRSRSQGETVLLCLPESQSVWLGEPAIISYYIYTDQRMDSFYSENENDYPGYGKSVYEQPQNLNYEDVQYKGRRFQRALIKRSAIFPQTTGRLQMPTLTGKIQFSGFYSYMNRKVDSSPAYINVKPLPAGKPAGFTGAVGKFSVNQVYSASKVTLGEAITCTVQVSGKGNFSQFTSPLFPSVDKFQVSEPSVDDKLRNPLEGTRHINYTLLPRETGEFTLPSVTFSWFDTSSGTYKTFRGQPQTVKVKQGNVLSYFSGLLEADAPKAMNPLLNRAIHSDFRPYVYRPWFWLVLAVLLLSLIASGIISHNNRLSREDPAAYAIKTANRVLNKYLRQATEAASRLSPEFYPLAESGLSQYLAKKFGISRSLGTGELLNELRQKDLPPRLIEQMEEFLLLCQEARYMPGGTEATDLHGALLKLRLLVQALSRLRFGNGKPRNRFSANTGNSLPEEKQ